MPFHCNICNIVTNSEAILNIHYNGSKHKRRAANPQASFQSRVEQIKAGGMNNFVRAENTSQVQSEQISTSGENSPFNLNPPPQGGSFEYCSTCRISLTSSLQAQVHYAGAKHLHKLQLLEEMKDNGTGDSSKSPTHYCETCQIKMTSLSQLEIHFSGNKHKQKCKLLQGAEQMNSSNVGGNSQNSTSQLMPFVDLNKVDHTFCDVCQTRFTSPSQAQMHYTGSKHRNALRVREEKKSMTSDVNPQDDGEPSAKKAKFVEICDTCNVKMLCPETASAHYNGLKHAKKIIQLKGPEPQENASHQKKSQYNTFQQGASGYNSCQTMSLYPMPGNQRNQMTRSQHTGAPPSAGPGGKKGGHFYCSFCDLSVNSQSQMDAHRSGLKHKAQVEGMSKPGANAPVPSFVKRKTVTNVYSMTTSQGSFPMQAPTMQAPPPPPPPLPRGNMIQHPAYQQHPSMDFRKEEVVQYGYHEMY